MDYAKLVGQNGALDKSEGSKVTPQALALADQVQAEAPAGVKSDVDALVTYLHKLAKGTETSDDASTMQSAYFDSLTWLSDRSHCPGLKAR